VNDVYKNCFHRDLRNVIIRDKIDNSKMCLCPLPTMRFKRTNDQNRDNEMVGNSKSNKRVLSPSKSHGRYRRQPLSHGRREL